MTRKLRPAYWIIIAISASLIGFIVWALWAELDQVTRAPGRVVPFARVQVVQSEEGGAISAINVREGDRVVAGQTLIELDEVQLAAGLEESRARVAALQSRMARIDAELFDRSLSFPTSVRDFPEFVANQRQLYQRRRNALNAEIGRCRTRRVCSAASSTCIVRWSRPAMSLASKSSGWSGASPRRRDRSPMSGRSTSATCRRVRADRGGAGGGGAGADAARRQPEGHPPARAGRRHREERAVHHGRRRRSPGDEVLEIVPTGERLVVEARVPPRDIAYMELGQQARINFDAYDSAVFGPADGEVVFIGPDTISEERDDGTLDTYYRVNLEVDTSRMRQQEADRPVDLQPGMTATAEILTGSQTVWEYLTKPILRTSRQSLQER